MRRSERIAAGILAASLVVLPFTARACDLALSLALDVSGSLTPAQQQEIRVGTAAALTNPEIVRSFAGNSVYLKFGYGSFVLPVADVAGYRLAMMRKLLREISMNVPNRTEG
jgi:hypothetical protein